MSRGSIYRRGKIWWFRYWHRGKRYQVSSASTKRSVALRLLQDHLARIRQGRAPGNTEEKVELKELLDEYRRDYEVNGRRSLEQAKIRVAHLKRLLGEDVRAIDITTDRIRRYQEARQQEGVGNGTINRETTALGRAFRLAIQGEKLSRQPYIPKLEEPPPREGFFEYDEYLAIREHLPEDLQDVLDFDYSSGWRKGEVLSLKWDDLDFSDAMIRLRAVQSKNKKPRPLPLSEPIKRVLERRLAKRTPSCPFVFHRNGKEIKSMDGAWDKARTAAGLPGKYFHDTRRTVARNLVRSGTSQDVAMVLTGHRSSSVFSRYNITTDADLRAATDRLTSYQEEQAAKRKKKVIALAPPA